MSFGAQIKMTEQPDFKEVLRKNRKTFLAILMLPVAGMVVSIFLIFLRAPQKLAIAGGVIILLICQYLVLLFYVSRRIDRIISS